MAHWLRDKERSAFGLGWETRRRGGTVDNNKFVIGSKDWQAFRQGFNEFKASLTACYEDESVERPSGVCGRGPDDARPKKKRRRRPE